MESARARGEHLNERAARLEADLRAAADVERAELAVLRGVRKEHWRRVRQVAMEVHDAEGGAKELEAIRALLLDPERGGFEPDRVVVEQPKGLEGSTLWNLYARR